MRYTKWMLIAVLSCGVMIGCTEQPEGAPPMDADTAPVTGEQDAFPTAAEPVEMENVEEEVALDAEEPEALEAEAGANADETSNADDALEMAEAEIGDEPTTAEEGGSQPMSDGPQRAVAKLQPTAGHEDASGMVTFTQEEDGVRIEAEISGLEPGMHGFHVHEFGDLTAEDGSSLGGHFNPTGEPHAGPEAAERHDGDLGNIEVGDDGTGSYSRVDSHLSLTGENSIIGRGFVVHAGQDDLESQPSGDAGARVLVGVIAVDEGEAQE